MDLCDRSERRAEEDAQEERIKNDVDGTTRKQTPWSRYIVTPIKTRRDVQVAEVNAAGSGGRGAQCTGARPGLSQPSRRRCLRLYRRQRKKGTIIWTAGILSLVHLAGGRSLPGCLSMRVGPGVASGPHREQH